jgi:RNA polymerase sigma-70 factor (sigma-E family)
MIGPVTAEVDPRLSPIDGEALFRDEYASLVRLAFLVLGDRGAAEEVVQDAFVKLHSRWRSIREPDKAGAWLRSVVLNGARSRRRGRPRLAAPAPVTVDAADAGALSSDLQQRTVVALMQLSARQREALVLKFYEGLGESEIAAAMGVSPGSVKTHVHRGIEALRSTLGLEEAQ